MYPAHIVVLENELLNQVKLEFPINIVQLVDYTPSIVEV